MALDEFGLTAEQDFAEAGRKLFASPCEFAWAASTIASLPPIGLPEVAFAGRSNVGKSSLLNALTGRNSLARTSHTPGRTQEINFFALGERLRLADLPGYGYAAVSREKVAAWTELMRAYLAGRASLLRVYLLIDGRHGIKPPDVEMMDHLDRAAVSYQLVLTKRDEVRKSEQATRVEDLARAIARRPAAFPQVLFTSARTGEGIEALRAAIARLLAERAD